MEKEYGPVRSVGKALGLLEILLARRAPMTLQELSAAAALPKSTAYALLSTLREHGMAEQRPDGRYYLGIRLFECGCAVSAAWDISAHPYLEQLAADTGASAFLSVLDGENAVSIDQCTGGAGLQVVPEIGSRLPLHATSQGKLLLSRFSDAEVLSRLAAAGMAAYTPHTITDPQRLLRCLSDVRAAGCAVEDGEYKIGLRAVSAPVFDRTGALRYAIGIVGLFRRVQSEEFLAAQRQVVRTAAQLTAALGGPR